jgi:hypothetical protein
VLERRESFALLSIDRTYSETKKTKKTLDMNMHYSGWAIPQGMPAQYSNSAPVKNL